MLLDSNIIIYAARSEHTAIREFISDHSPAVSAITYVEALGYHRLTERERLFLESFFSASPVLGLSQLVLEQAVKLRQIRKMTLGDALVAATALSHGLKLVTRNTKDFVWIAGLTVLNPFQSLGHPPIG